MIQKILLFLPGIVLFLPVSGQTTDPELAEKLKSVMVLFDKNQQALKDEIKVLTESNVALTEANFKLYQDLQATEKRVETLESENLILRSKISEIAVKELEAASLTPAGIPEETGVGRAPLRSVAGQSAQAQLKPGGSSVKSLININTATKEELAGLPLIDEAMALQVISNRPYNSIEDLIINQGFGPMKLRRISPFITAE